LIAEHFQGASWVTVALTGLTTVVADPDVFSCELAGGKALLDLRSSTYYSINSVGAFVWERLAAPITVSQLHSAMIDEFDVEPERCLADLKALVQQFAAAGLVRLGNERGD
jgi:hypothetical protein